MVRARFFFFSDIHYPGEAVYGQTFFHVYRGSNFLEGSFNKRDTLFFINNQKFKQLPRKFIISKQFVGANKRRKLNNPLGEQTKTFSCIGNLRENAHFWSVQKCALHTVGVSMINYGDV